MDDHHLRLGYMEISIDTAVVDSIGRHVTIYFIIAYFRRVEWDVKIATVSLLNDE